MKVAIENLLRVKGAQLCTEEVDPADIDAAIEEKREPKKRRVCIAKGFPQSVLIQNGYTKDELKKAAKKGLIQRKKTVVNGGEQNFWCVPVDHDEVK